MDEFILKRKNNDKKKLITLILSLGLILVITGVSYAFFAYYKTGLYTHTINGGKMNVIYDEVTGNNIKIDNAYPLTDEEALNEAIEFEFTITGYNESEKNIYYAIEMDHGSEIENKERFKDTDMKLTLYENEELVMENEIFQDLDNQGIYYGYIKYGTSKESPTINNYKLRLWINDNVYIHNAIDDDISLWDDYDLEWAEKHLDYDILNRIYNNEITKLSEAGISIYNAEEFGTRYGSFKVNVEANLSGDDIGILVYDANGGEYEPKVTSLATNMVTMQKPVMEGKGFLGWSTKKDGDEVDYFAGDYYSGPATTLYAVYSDIKNVMGTFPNLITEGKEYISEVHFINDTRENIDARYNVALEQSIATDLTLDNQGSVKGWVEQNSDSEYVLYVGSVGTTYLTDCSSMFASWSSLRHISFANVDTSMVVDMSHMFSETIEDMEQGGGSDVLPILYEKENVETSFLNSMTTIEGGENHYNVNELTKLDLTAFNTLNVKNFESMFGTRGSLGSTIIDTYYIPLIELDISTFDTSNATNMRNMFNSLIELEELDISKFNTSNVTDMSRMFANCNGLSETLVNSFDTTNVTDMSYMFERVELPTIDLNNLVTNKVTNMSGMFANSAFKELDLSKFDTSNVINMSGMFYGAITENLKSYNFGDFDTSNVENMSEMFSNCSYNELDLNFLETNNVTNMKKMFYWSKINKIEMNDKDMSKVVDMTFMFGYSNTHYVNFRNCIMNPSANLDYFLDYAYYRNWDFSGSINLININFRHSSYGNNRDLLESVNFSYCNFGERTYLPFFEYCYELKYVDFSNIVAPNVTSVSAILKSCHAEYITFKNATFPSLELLSGFFDMVTAEYVDMSGMNIENTTLISTFMQFLTADYVDMRGMNIANVKKIQEISYYSNIGFLDLSNMIMGSLTDVYRMFYECGSIDEIDFTGFDTSKVSSMNEMFSTSGVKYVDLSNFDLSEVTDMSGMFANAYNLIEFEAANITVASSIKMSNMFVLCSKLEKVDLSGFVTNVAQLQDTFLDCTNLKVLDISGFTFPSSLVYYSRAFQDVGLNLVEGTYTTVYVKSATEQNWMLTKPSVPKGWSTANIIVKS